MKIKLVKSILIALFKTLLIPLCLTLYALENLFFFLNMVFKKLRKPLDKFLFNW